jgi:hypothetical protein
VKAALPKPDVATKKGKPVFVILPIKQHQEMIERLEDAEDVAWLKKLRREKLHYRPLEDVLADLAKRSVMYQVVVERSMSYR